MNQCIDGGIEATCLQEEQGMTCFWFFKACLASLVVHRAWLDSTVHMENAFCCSPFWSEAISFSDHVTACYPWSRIVDTPEITELPVDVMYMKMSRHCSLRVRQ